MNALIRLGKKLEKQKAEKQLRLAEDEFFSAADWFGSGPEVRYNRLPTETLSKLIAHYEDDTQIAKLFEELDFDWQVSFSYRLPVHTYSDYELRIKADTRSRMYRIEFCEITSLSSRRQELRPLFSKILKRICEIILMHPEDYRELEFNLAAAISMQKGYIDALRFLRLSEQKKAHSKSIDKSTCNKDTKKRSEKQFVLI